MHVLFEDVAVDMYIFDIVDVFDIVDMYIFNIVDTGVDIGMAKLELAL